MTRITYVGELGYEIFVPVEQATHVLERLHAAAKVVGQEELAALDSDRSDGSSDSSGDGSDGGAAAGWEGLRSGERRQWAEALAAGGVPYAGLKALGSLRMEKGYRDYGHDLDNTDSLVEAGLGFTADLGKVSLFAKEKKNSSSSSGGSSGGGGGAGGDGGDASSSSSSSSVAFIGSDFVAAEKAGGVKNLKQRLVQVLLHKPNNNDNNKGDANKEESEEDEELTAFMFHGEVVLRDGEVVGDVRAASYGHTLGGAVGLAMVSH